jgi:hypothetical protein
VVRLLLDSYMRQKLCVMWDSHKSRYFNVSNGVKQGGVLSPILFTIYIDELLLKLKQSSLGCHFNSQYVGVLGYADDLTLMSPSIRSLNKMLDICKYFAADFNITFNPKKTLCIKFGTSLKEKEKAFLDGSLIKWVNSVKHLGNTVCNDLSDTVDCNNKRSIFIGYVNKLIGNYGKLHWQILYKLFRSYCSSFYGSQLWRFNSTGFNKCCISWNKAIRRLLHLSPRCHTWILGPTVNQFHISTQLQIKALKFHYSMLSSSNILIQTMSKNALIDANSPIGSQFAYLRYMYNIDYACDIKYNIAKILKYNKLTSSEQGVIDNIKTLLDVKNNTCEITNFNVNDIDMILYDITVS